MAPSIETAAAIRFEDGRAVEFAEAFDYADAQNAVGKLAWPSEVIWEDGSYSYAKGWVKGGTLRLVQIGAGAYGNMPLLDRKG